MRPQASWPNCGAATPRQIPSDLPTIALTPPSVELVYLRQQLAYIQQAINDARLAAYGNVRSYRNLLVLVFFVLLLILVAFPIGVRSSEAGFLTLTGTPAPEEASSTSTTRSTTTASTSEGATATTMETSAIPPPPTTVATPAAIQADQSELERRRLFTRHIATIEVWGAFGGVVGALVALRRINGFRGPYGLQFAQVALKLPAGAFVALFALVLLQSAILPPLASVAGGKLAAYAALFGFAQESVTRLVDQQAGRLLGAARSTSDPEKTPAGAGG
jgi:hypothetical protein